MTTEARANCLLSPMGRGWPNSGRVMDGAKRLPPPLTPPHKGEGDSDAHALGVAIFGSWCRRGRRCSPPPCGEGLGVGVLQMPSRIRPAAISRARRLRRTMTDGERRLWSELREFRHWHGIHVRRQAPLGPYVVDFVVHEQRLVIEVDGEHHFTASGLSRDRVRDDWLATQGYKVLRFNTGELEASFSGCVEEIMRELGLMLDTPAPQEEGGRG